MLRPLFCHCRAPRGAACFGEKQTAAGLLRAAEGSRRQQEAATILRQSTRLGVADVRASMACDGQLSSAGHISHALVQTAVQRCRLGTRWCDASAPRDVDAAKRSHPIRAIASANRTRSAHCRPPWHRASRSTAPSIRQASRWTDARCGAQALPATQLHSHGAQHAVAQVMVCATRMKRVQTVRCVRAMRARSNTRTACHCTAWPIDPSQP